MTWHDHITTERRMRRRASSILLDIMVFGFILTVAVVLADNILRLTTNEEQIGTWVYNLIH